MYNLHTCVWRRARLRRSRDWLRWCVWFNERSLALVWATWAFVHGLNRTRRGDREPGIGGRIHRIPPRFYHASLLASLAPHYSYSNDTVHTQSVQVSLLRMFTWYWRFAGVPVGEKGPGCEFLWTWLQFSGKMSDTDRKVEVKSRS